MQPATVHDQHDRCQHHALCRKEHGEVEQANNQQAPVGEHLPHPEFARSPFG